MKKKLTKHGNSFEVIIDKPILKLLSINEKTALKISTDGKIIIIEPLKTKKTSIETSNKKLKESYNKLVEKYEPAMKKLAKT